MEAPTAQSAPQQPAVDVYSFLGWLDQNRKPLIAGAVIVLVVGVLVAFVVWRKGAREVQAGQQLTALLASGGAAGVAPDALLKFAADFSGTAAAARAQLSAAAKLFEEGKYAEAQAAFQKFLADYPENPLAPQASLGAATALEAQGKTAEAISAYKALSDRRQGAASAQARFALARLYQAEGRLAEARDLYSALAGDPMSLMGSEASGRLNDLLRQHPELRPAPASLTNTLQVVPGN
jgi:predicted negative regulator of RcsB-dependent stress response